MIAPTFGLDSAKALASSGPQRSTRESNTVAVLEFEGTRVRASSLRLWSDMLRAALIEEYGAALQVLTAGNQEVLLRQNGVDVTKCDDDACDVDLLRTLSVDYGFSGAMTKTRRGSYLGTLILYNTEKGVALGAAQIRAENEEALIDSIVKQGVELCSRFLSAAPEGKETLPPALTTNTTEEVYFFSDPEGIVYVDGALVCETTPCGHEVAVGRRKVEIVFPLGAMANVYMDLQKGQPLGVNAVLEPMPRAIVATNGFVHFPNQTGLAWRRQGGRAWTKIAEMSGYLESSDDIAVNIEPGDYSIEMALPDRVPNVVDFHVLPGQAVYLPKASGPLRDSYRQSFHHLQMLVLGTTTGVMAAMGAILTGVSASQTMSNDAIVRNQAAWSTIGGAFVVLTLGVASVVSFVVAGENTPHETYPTQ